MERSMRIPLKDISPKNIMFYDIETTEQFAQYCDLTMISVAYGNEEPQIIETKEQNERFTRSLANPEMLKVTFNGLNFDNKVLWNHDYPYIEEGQIDVYLLAKACLPVSPSYGLKFLSWYFFNDIHEPEYKLETWAKENNKDKWLAPPEILSPYCKHDVIQTRKLFKFFWDNVVKNHWEAYQLDMRVGMPIFEMEMKGGMWLDTEKIKKELHELDKKKKKWEKKAFDISGGEVTNPNSVQQVVKYLTESEGVDLKMSEKGNLSFDKAAMAKLIDFEEPKKDSSPMARCVYEIRNVYAITKYFDNYTKAIEAYPVSEGGLHWIPKSFSISNAKTRRFTSNSKFKLNFQNSNEYAERVQMVPEGYLGWWIDSTQIENVVHIYESEDTARRYAYEEDENWNEYVWLCNQSLKEEYTKAELENMQSPVVSQWSIYKQFKTVKLALNFGMGIDLFCQNTGVTRDVGKKLFDEIHKACPAIRGLQNIVTHKLKTHGYVRDVFGHIYSGKIRQVYKVVAYLVQGCGTGSLPKAQIRANWETLQALGEDAGHLCGTTHDENSGRIKLSVGKDKIFATLQNLMYNMTDKFSYKFDSIPLRAKLYLSRTNGADKQEVDIKNKKEIYRFL